MSSMLYMYINMHRQLSCVLHVYVYIHTLTVIQSPNLTLVLTRPRANHEKTVSTVPSSSWHWSSNVLGSVDIKLITVLHNTAGITCTTCEGGSGHSRVSVFRCSTPVKVASLLAVVGELHAQQVAAKLLHVVLAKEFVQNLHFHWQLVHQSLGHQRKLKAHAPLLCLACLADEEKEYHQHVCW